MNADAAALLIKGRRNVTVRGLTVQNGLNNIKIVETGAAWLEDVTVQNSRLKEGHDSSHGIVVSGAASVVLTGDIVADDNVGAGITVWGSSSSFVAGNIAVDGNELPGASLQANRNGTHGIEVGVSSSFHAFSGSGVPVTIEFNNNGMVGINGVNGASVQLGGGVDVEATGNGAEGLSAVHSGSVRFQEYDSPQTRRNPIRRNLGWRTMPSTVLPFTITAKSPFGEGRA